MHRVKPTETMILVATGKLVGEGFDYSKAGYVVYGDTCFFSKCCGTVCRRLNRDYEGKENVIVYDYVDSHIPMFDNMYAKRLKAYKQIGYNVCAGLTNEKQRANAIFDSDTFLPVYQKGSFAGE